MTNYLERKRRRCSIKNMMKMMKILRNKVKIVQKTKMILLDLENRIKIRCFLSLVARNKKGF